MIGPDFYDLGRIPRNHKDFYDLGLDSYDLGPDPAKS